MLSEDGKGIKFMGRDMNRGWVSMERNVLSQKALSLHEDVSKDPLKRVTNSHLLQERDGYTESRIGLAF